MCSAEGGARRFEHRVHGDDVVEREAGRAQIRGGMRTRETKQVGNFYSAIRDLDDVTKTEMVDVLAELASATDDPFLTTMLTTYGDEACNMHDLVLASIRKGCNVEFLKTAIADKVQLHAGSGNTEENDLGFAILHILFYATILVIGVMSRKANVSESVALQAVNNARWNMNKAFEGRCGWQA